MDVILELQALAARLRIHTQAIRALFRSQDTQDERLDVLEHPIEREDTQ